MEEIIQEAIIPKAKDIQPLNQTELKHKVKCFCKIIGNLVGTGFFCKITYEDKLIPVLITNYHVIDDNYILENDNLKIYINDDYKIIKLKNRKIYSSYENKYDIMILKLKDEDEINDYLEIDKNIFKHNSENSYKNDPIYILQYPDAKEAAVSYGIGIEKISEYEIKHLCNTKNGSSGGPIINSLNDKVIGLHRGYIKRKVFNIGTFLKFPLNELNKNLKKIIIIIL